MRNLILNACRRCCFYCVVHWIVSFSLPPAPPGPAVLLQVMSSWIIERPPSTRRFLGGLLQYVPPEMAFSVLIPRIRFPHIEKVNDSCGSHLWLAGFWWSYKPSSYSMTAFFSWFIYFFHFFFLLKTNLHLLTFQRRRTPISASLSVTPGHT